MVKREITHILDTFSEGASSAIQLTRRCQNTLTAWPHFQKKPHQWSSLPEDARTHSHPGHIFRRGLISHPACQKMPEGTHSLDTFENTLSVIWPVKVKIHSQSKPIFKAPYVTLRPFQQSWNILTFWNHYFMFFLVSYSDHNYFIPPALLYQYMFYSEISILTVLSYKQCFTLLLPGYNMYYSHTINTIVDQSLLLYSKWKSHFLWNCESQIKSLVFFHTQDFFLSMSKLIKYNYWTHIILYVIQQC